MGRHPEVKAKSDRDWLKAVSVIFARMLKDDDTRFFAGAHLGLTIQEVQAYYGNLENVTAMWHSDAPTGQEQVDFRTDAVPQRRIYVYYRKDDGKIVSVSYWKLGAGEIFSPSERNALVKLSGNRADLVARTLDSDPGLGSEFEVTTPEQFRVEQQAN